MKSVMIVLGLVTVLALALYVQASEDTAQDAATASFDPATVMPPDTKVYVELGSPGKQIETIFKMFDGTPLEETLKAMLAQPHQKDGPARIIQGFMNPSMIAEFKKIQGAAVGITGINDEMPEFVAVLAPGKSDAVRGLIIAALSMGATPAESIQGLQLWTIDNMISIAHDGNIFIASNSAEKFQEAIARYKNPSAFPSLAASELFQQPSRDQRSTNLLTAWIDGKQTYQELARIMKAEGDSEELAIFNMMADPTHIQRILMQLSLQENNIVLDLDLALDEQHQCHAYNLVRTPALTQQGLSMVPSDAIALAAFSLGDADTPGAEKLHGALKQMTGLDIGRELFANIEQINIFVVDPQNITDIQELPVATLGIAITSKNGEKTKTILDTLFKTAYQAMQASPEFQNILADVKEGQYPIPIDDMKLNCYLQQKGNITILSPSKQIISKCFNQTSRSTTRSLEPVFENMPKTTSKLIVINAGGVARLIDKIILMENKNPFNPAHRQLNDFSKSLNGMNICIRTSETPAYLNLNASINDIPPLGPLFPKVMELAQADFNAKGCATNPIPCNQSSIAPSRPYQLQWHPGIGSQSHKVYFGTDPANLSLLTELSNTSTIDGPAMDNNIETCYWRVDEIMPDGSVITGDLWNFSKGKMIAHYKLDESAGTIAKDTAGQNHDGILKNQPNWHPTEGIQSGAIELDGQDDAIEIKDLSFVTNTATFTAWVKGWKASDWSGIVFARTWQPCGMHFGQNNTLHYTWNNNSSQTYTWEGGPAIPQDQWAFVAIVVKPDKTIAYVYDENNGFQSAENNVPNMPQNIHDLKIGCDTEQPNRYFKGLIDDVRIYNYDLTLDEVKLLTLKHTASL